jgi:hypothetical protein
MKLLAVITLIIGIAAANSAYAGDSPLFVGDGFVVTQGDVDRLRTFYEEGGVGVSLFTSDEQHLKMALNLRLLSLEALEQGLDEGVTEGLDSDDPFFEEKRMFRLAQRYMQTVIDNYPVSDVVILSYYRANPEKYEATPLNEAVRKEVRQKVAVAKKKSIQDDAVEKLMIKYHVRSTPETGK